jgi:hypothetical protein
MMLKLRQSTNWIPTGNGRGADGWPGITTNVQERGDVETFIFIKFTCGKKPHVKVLTTVRASSLQSRGRDTFATDENIT